MIYYRLLIYNCTLTPLFLAFPDIYNDPMLIVDQTLNAMFAVDILF